MQTMCTWISVGQVFIFTTLFIRASTEIKELSPTFDERQQKFEQGNTDIRNNIKKQWYANFTPESKEMFMDTSDDVLLEIYDVDTTQNYYKFRLKSDSTHLASVDYEIFPNNSDFINGKWRGNITINAHFLGSTKIYVERVNINLNSIYDVSDEILNLIIVRRMRIVDHVFTGSVATLVSLLYINFGAALDMRILRAIVVRPVGPCIGLVTQFVLMPVLSYFLGYLIFPKSPELHLGLFFTGCSPAGGASNIWTALLGGNLNLSVLMTTIGLFVSFGMMPFWLLTLGHLIFVRSNIKIPYMNIITYAVALIVPLGIGLLIQKYSPRLCRILRRSLKPISTCLIVFIIVFAIITNLYLFELFSWQIILAGLSLPLFGYTFAWILATLLKQNPKDVLTIAIETGIQNTGIAIFLLRFSLPQPQADLTTVIPVSVAIMSPFPLLAFYIYKFFKKGNAKIDEQIVNEQTI